MYGVIALQLPPSPYLGEKEMRKSLLVLMPVMTVANVDSLIQETGAVPSTAEAIIKGSN